MANSGESFRLLVNLCKLSRSDITNGIILLTDFQPCMRLALSPDDRCRDQKSIALFQCV
jgi:hypothetical protein